MRGLNLSLALQLINVWDFTPMNKDVEILINDNHIPYIKKMGGYRIITKELPKIFKITVATRDFYNFSLEVDEIPKNKIIPIQLIPFYPRGKSETAWLEIKAPLENGKVVLGRSFLPLSAESSQHILSIKNQERINLEGRHFLLRDLKTQIEEFLTLDDGRNVLFTEFNTSPLKNTYTINSVLLPAFSISGIVGRIPLQVMENSKYPIWIYTPEAEKYEISSNIEIKI